MYEPTWSQPLVDWQPNASFREAATPPIDGPADGDLVQLPCINVDWLPLVLGALDQLRNPSTWLDTLSDSTRELVLSRADHLRSMFGAAVNVPCCNVEIRLTSGCTLQYSTDGGTTWVDVTDWNANFDSCVRAAIPPPVPVPINPGVPTDNACAVATWLALNIMQIATQKLAAALQAGQAVDKFIAEVVQAIVAFAPILEFITGPFETFYSTALPQPLADLQAAAADNTFFSDVKCAIYSGISGTGYVTAANFSTVASNIAAISYTHAWVPTMLGNLWNSLGLTLIQNLQAQGSLTGSDCSDCGGGWCHYFDFTLNSGGWSLFFPSAYGQYVSGLGWQSTYPHTGAFDGVVIQFDLGGTFAITEVQVYVNSTTGGSGSHQSKVHVENAPGGSDVCAANLSVPNNSPGYTWIAAASACSGRNIVVDVSGGDVSGVTHSTIISAIQIRGTGTSPFTGNNCIVGP